MDKVKNAENAKKEKKNAERALLAKANRASLNRNGLRVIFQAKIVDPGSTILPIFVSERNKDAARPRVESKSFDWKQKRKSAKPWSETQRLTVLRPHINPLMWGPKTVLIPRCLIGFSLYGVRRFQAENVYLSTS